MAEVMRRTRREGFAKKKTCKTLEGVARIDHTDIDLLRKFVTERGKILPQRITGTTAAQQRELARAIKRARTMGLLP